jgi:hypothetical protein
MKTDGSELEDVGWVAAEAALAAAQQMPGGRERIAALKEAGLLRFEADERRRAIRDQEHASKLDLARQIEAQRLLAREPENRGRPAATGRVENSSIVVTIPTGD